MNLIVALGSSVTLPAWKRELASCQRHQRLELVLLPLPRITHSALKTLSRRSRMRLGMLSPHSRSFKSFGSASPAFSLPFFCRCRGLECQQVAVKNRSQATILTLGILDRLTIKTIKSLARTATRNLTGVMPRASMWLRIQVKPSRENFMTPHERRPCPLTIRLAQDLKIRNMAERTIDAYTYHAGKFADFIY